MQPDRRVPQGIRRYVISARAGLDRLFFRAVEPLVLWIAEMRADKVFDAQVSNLIDVVMDRRERRGRA